MSKKENCYLLTEDDFFKIVDLSSSLGLAIEKIILNSRLPKLYDWKHPAIEGYKKLIEEELGRKNPAPDLDQFYDSSTETEVTRDFRFLED
jgi:hypothetical protein